MASFINILLISLSLSMDALGVGIVGGINSKKTKIVHALKIAVFFGTFQAVMPVMGWLISRALENYISAIDHWVAFFLLGFIGIKMIRDSSKEKDKPANIVETKILLMLSVATSIDALIVGMTLNLLNTPFLLSIFSIGLTTFALSFLGFLFGKQIGLVFGKKVTVLGGVALIFIGFKILLEHLAI